jgi:predicted N-acetyltransferase YhbS
VRLDLTSLALAGDEVVAYSVVEDFAGQNVLFHRTVAVAPAWQERGIGEALVESQIAAGRIEGVEAMVAVPPTDALAGLYARLGYAPRKTWVELEGPVG